MKRADSEGMSTIRYFITVTLCLNTSSFIECSSCPGKKKRSIFVHTENKKSLTSEKLGIKESNTQYDCKLECAKRFDCRSYDYFHEHHYCVLSFNEGDNHLVEMKGWAHAQKKLIKVCLLYLSILSRQEKRRLF